MTSEQFEAKVRRFESLSVSHPRLYRFWVVTLVVLGYGYLLGILIAMVGVIGLLVALLMTGKGTYVAIKLMIPAVIVTGMVTRSFWVRMDAPSGIPLTRDDAPELFAAIDELRHSLQTPRVHQVLVTDDFNAAVAQVPRLGVLGWQRNYLILGLPLLLALSPREFRAVLAHEFGHLSGNHGRFSGYIYRVRRTWDKLVEQFQASGHGGSWLFRWFFNWYIPNFSACSFVLARADEYVADRCAADATSERTAARTLARVELAGRYLSEAFWPTLYKRAATEAEPPRGTMSSLAQALRQSAGPDKSREWISEALARRTDCSDTHPCLSERLGALGLRESQRESLVEELAGEEGTESNAAREYLGASLDKLLEIMSMGWYHAVREPWQGRYQECQSLRDQLAELDGKAGSDTLTTEEKWMRAKATGELHGSEAAEALYREVLAGDPAHAEANFALAMRLLDRKDDAALVHFDRAMESDADAVFPCCQAAFHFLEGQGRHDDARRYRRIAEQHAEKLGMADQERQSVSESDGFLPPELDREAVEILKGQLAALPEIRRAWYVRKAVTLFPEKPFYILLVEPVYVWYKTYPSDYAPTLARKIADQLTFPHGTLVQVEKRGTKLQRRIDEVPGGLIYDSGK